MRYDEMSQEQLEERRQDLVQQLNGFSKDGDRDKHPSGVEDEIHLIDKALERFV